jgi:hypothetical protein
MHSLDFIADKPKQPIKREQTLSEHEKTVLKYLD